jgi:epoxyqueuosine reductase QueG
VRERGIVILDRDTLIHEIIKYAAASADNYVGEQAALKPELAGLKLFDEPLVGFADAADSYFYKFKADAAIGNNFMLPREWNDEAKTVISIFFPFTRRIKESNRNDPGWPSPEWLHGRIEGQSFIGGACGYIQSYLEDHGFKTVVPCIDQRFSSKSPVTTDRRNEKYYTSNWSERHIAYVCGLGTFGLSKGLITSRGIAGRFGSLITSGYFAPDTRSYMGIYEYCNSCGRCVRNCPVQAISLEHGKIHAVCSAFLELTKQKHKPWYGCGKCQVNVSCENGIPGRK